MGAGPAAHAGGLRHGCAPGTPTPNDTKGPSHPPSDFPESVQFHLPEMSNFRLPLTSLRNLKFGVIHAAFYRSGQVRREVGDSPAFAVQRKRWRVTSEYPQPPLLCRQSCR